jgi:hypothetical protein
MPTVAINPSIIGRLQPAAGNQSAIPSNEVSSTRTTGHKLSALERNSPRVRHRQLAWAFRRCSVDNCSHPASRASTTMQSAPSASSSCPTLVCRPKERMARTRAQPNSKTPASPMGTASSRNANLHPVVHARRMVIR